MSKDPLKVFISYTGEDLCGHAQAAVKAVQVKEWVPIDPTFWPASGTPSLTACLEKVRECDLMVVLSAHRYGWVPAQGEEGGDGEKSVCWLEYQEARTAGIPVLPFLVHEDHPWPPKRVEASKDPLTGERLERFQKVLRLFITGFFTTEEDLHGRVASALGAKEDEARRIRKERRGKISSLVGEGEDAVAVFSSSDPLTRYTSYLEKRFRDLELLGLGVQPIHLPLAQVYVPLKTCLPRSLEVMKGGDRYRDQPFDRAEHLEADLDLDRAFRLAEEGGCHGVVVLGEPGSGKTTAARYLTWRCADVGQGPESLGLPGGLLPVWLPLRRLQGEHEKEGLKGHLFRGVAGIELSDGQELGKALWKRGGLLWVLDGLDEVADLGLRRKVSQLVSADHGLSPSLLWLISDCGGR